MNYFYTTGVYAFTLGCVSFTWDAFTARPINKKILLGCLLFDVGCFFFALDAHEVYDFEKTS